MLSTYISTNAPQLIFNDISNNVFKKHISYKRFFSNVIKNVIFIGGSYILDYDDFDFDFDYDNFIF
jgi:hypothetical protein